MRNRKILITGAGGLIGSRLQAISLERGYLLHLLARHTVKTTAETDQVPQQFEWDPESGRIDERAFEGVEAIIHLAGAPVSAGPWTAGRKKEILESRINSTRLLYKTLSCTSHPIKTLVSASAVGYYGDCGGRLLFETEAPGHDFLAGVVGEWESEVNAFGNLGIRPVCCRIGIVLSGNGGALPELTKTLPAGLAVYFCKDPLFYPWVHIDDVCGILLHAVENDAMRGSYNTTAPHPEPMKALIAEIVKARKKRAVLAPVPPAAVRFALGEMAEMLLSSQNCSAEKILGSGYRFRFPGLKEALKDIYK